MLDQLCDWIPGDEEDADPGAAEELPQVHVLPRLAVVLPRQQHQEVHRTGEDERFESSQIDLNHQVIVV